MGFTNLVSKFLLSLCPHTGSDGGSAGVCAGGSAGGSADGDGDGDAITHATFAACTCTCTCTCLAPAPAPAPALALAPVRHRGGDIESTTTRTAR